MEFEKGDIVRLKKERIEHREDGTKIGFNYGIINNIINDVCEIIVFNQEGKILLSKNKGIMIPLRVDINKDYLILCLKYNEPYGLIRI